MCCWSWRKAHPRSGRGAWERKSDSSVQSHLSIEERAQGSKVSSSSQSLVECVSTAGTGHSAQPRRDFVSAEEHAPPIVVCVPLVVPVHSLPLPMASLLDDLNDLGSDQEEEQISVRPAGSSHTADAAAAAARAAAAAHAAASASAADDLEDLEEEDSEEEEGEGEEGSAAGGGGGGSSSSSSRAGSSAAAGSAAVQGEELPRDAALDAEMASLAPGASGLAAVARLRSTRRFQEHMRRVAESMAAAEVPAVVGPLEEWPEYVLVVASNALLSALDDELHAVHRFIVAAYAARFPELESVVPAMAEFVRVVALIGEWSPLPSSSSLSPTLPSPLFPLSSSSFPAPPLLLRQ